MVVEFKSQYIKMLRDNLLADVRIISADGSATSVSVTGCLARFLLLLIERGPHGVTPADIGTSSSNAAVYASRLRRQHGFDVASYTEPHGDRRISRYFLRSKVEVVTRSPGQGPAPCAAEISRRRQLARRITALGAPRLDLLFDDIAAAYPRLDELLERHARTADLAGARP